MKRGRPGRGGGRTSATGISNAPAGAGFGGGKSGGLRHRLISAVPPAQSKPCACSASRRFISNWSASYRDVPATDFDSPSPLSQSKPAVERIAIEGVKWLFYKVSSDEKEVSISKTCSNSMLLLGQRNTTRRSAQSLHFNGQKRSLVWWIDFEIKAAANSCRIGQSAALEQPYLQELLLEVSLRCGTSYQALREAGLFIGIRRFDINVIDSLDNKSSWPNSSESASQYFRSGRLCQPCRGFGKIGSNSSR